MALVAFNGKAIQHDLKLLRQEFADMPDGLFRRQIRSVLRKVATPLQPQFKQAAPRKTGTLRRSVKLVAAKGKDLTVKVGFGRQGGGAAKLLHDGTKDRFTRDGRYRGKIVATKFANGPLTSARAAGRNLVPEIKAALDRGLKQRAQWLAARQKARSGK